ncbi:hypothetical protein MsAg5_06350 [Methanosarcinaceae archaeon Ag5]|uniref:GLUG domain-containing protein n=1 Tax=Methanolapillus africanus TaxID=3028297 RepID=A0AAE4MIX4_9EURY|nr:hypothetical protein [Methanosarcinaceae archaeon Ag5]
MDSQTKKYVKIGIIILIVILLALLLTTCLNTQKGVQDCKCSVSNPGNNSSAGFEADPNKGGSPSSPSPMNVTPGGNGTPVNPSGPQALSFSAELYDYQYDTVSNTGTLRLMVTANKTITAADITEVEYSKINGGSDDGTLTPVVVEYLPAANSFLVSVTGAPLDTPNSGNVYAYSITNGNASTISQTANYPFESGTGADDSGNEFVIDHIVQFDALRYYTGSFGSGKYFKINAGLELPDDWNVPASSDPTDAAYYERAYTDENGWQPIGDATAGFGGKLDGGNAELSKFYINRTAADDQGLFGITAASSEIKNMNLNLTGRTIEGKDNVGSLVGRNYGKVTDSQMNGGTIAGNQYVGGLIGSNGDVSLGVQGGAISNSHAGALGTPIIVSGNKDVGGLIGDNDGPVSNTYVFATVNEGPSAGSNISGFIGYNHGNGTLTSVNATVTVNAAKSHNVGGLVGNNNGAINVGTGTPISVSGTITGNQFVGGLLGQNLAPITGTAGSLVSTDVSVTGNNSTGGFIGKNMAAVSYAQSNGTVTAGSAASSKELGGFIGNNTGELSYVSAVCNVAAPDSSYVGGLLGNNTISGAKSGKVFDSNAGTAANPISVTGKEYVGGLIGENNVTAKPSVSTTTVNAAVVGSGTGKYVGGFVGNNNGSISLSNSMVNASVSAPNSNGVGGFIGQNNIAGSIQVLDNLEYSNPVKGYDETGGFIGNNTGTITMGSNSITMKSNVDGNNIVGGYIGWNNRSVSNVSVGGTTDSVYVNGTDNTGGLIGRNNGTISSSSVGASNGQVLVSGNVNIGGMVGYNRGAISTSNIGTATTPISVFGYTDVGGMVGNNGASINNSSVYSTVNEGGTGANRQCFGGLIGNKTASDDIVLNNVSVVSTVTAENSNDVGGVIGKNMGNIKIDSPLTFSSETKGKTNVGGFIGNNYGTGKKIDATATNNITVKGNVTGVNSVGGLIGLNQQLVSNMFVGLSTSPVTVTGNSNVGGLIGSNSGTVLSSNVTVIVNEKDVSAAYGSGFGSFVGYNNANGNITFDAGNMLISSTINAASSTKVGGAVGSNHASAKITINSVSLETPVSGKNDVGGFVGYNAGIIDIQGPLSFSESVTGSNSVGGFIGNNTGTIAYKDSSSIVTMESAAKVSGVEFVGGYMGNNTNAGSEIYYVQAFNDVEGLKRVGGLIGYNNGKMSNVMFGGNVNETGSGTYFGGLAGWNQGQIDNSFSTGNINAGTSREIGGLIGIMNGTSPSLQNCYSSGNVVGNYSVGGLVGSASNSAITNSVALNSGISGNDRVYRIAGFNSGVLTDNYALDSLTGTSDPAGLDGANVTQTDAQTQAFYTTAPMDWDFATPIWEITSGSYPVLAWM